MSTGMRKAVLKFSTFKNIKRKISEDRGSRKEEEKPAPEVKLARRKKQSLSLDPQILLQWATTYNDVETLKRVVETSSVDLNAPGVDGFYPLHRAASTGSYECLEYLVTKGAQLEVRDKDGSSPLDAAVSEGEFDCARFLIEKGASINHIRDGFTDKDLLHRKPRAMSLDSSGIGHLWQAQDLYNFGVSTISWPARELLRVELGQQCKWKYVQYVCTICVYNICVQYAFHSVDKLWVH